MTNQKQKRTHFHSLYNQIDATMHLPGMVKKRGSAVAMQQIWAQQQEANQQRTVERCRSCDDTPVNQTSVLDLETSIEKSPSFSNIDEMDKDVQNDIGSEMTQSLLPLQQRRNTKVVSNTSLSSMIDKTITAASFYDSNHIVNTNSIGNNKVLQNHHKASTIIAGMKQPPALPSSASSSTTTKGLSTSVANNILPLFRHSPSPPIPDAPLKHTTGTVTTSSSNTSTAQTKAVQLLIGAAGIYATYLYYGVVQEDLFRYRSSSGVGFSFVWALQVLESAMTMAIGYAGRKLCGGRKKLPLWPFFHSGISQLAAKALMSLSLAAGLSFPVVVLAKSAKIVPVMIGQLLLGGSKYGFHDYLFAVMIVAGTSLLSVGNTSESVPAGSDTLTGLFLITLSLTADGFTGGLQKKLKRVTASMAPTTYDFLFYSHVAQFCAAIVVCFVTREMYTAPAYLVSNPIIWWWIGASCICSAVGQCFIFYVISCFDPVVCTTITTTRKMLTVAFSIGFKGHDLSSWGYIGLGLAVSALILEVETKYTEYQLRQKGTVEVKLPAATSSQPSTATSTSSLSINDTNEL